MRRFLESYPLQLTPLTPIHVGCGEDFVPTNYVIAGGALFHFDPAMAPFSADERRKLCSAAAADGDEAIRRVQRFFFERREMLLGASHNIVAVTGGIADQYEERIGQIAQSERSGRRIVNVLEIERTAHHPHTEQAYIPGSSLKGALRTAWLDQLNGGREGQRGERSSAMEERVLKCDSHADPFRLVKLADASGNGVVTQVVFSTNHKKNPVMDGSGRVRAGKGPATEREAIVPAQYRALRTEIRLEGFPDAAPRDMLPSAEKRIGSFESLAEACNRFYLKRLQADLEVLESRGFATDTWLGQLRSLLRDLEGPLRAGRAMLLRVGRHSGAESVTLEGVRSIRIMRGRGQPADTSRKGATTLWLAAEHEDARSGMQPFGWLLAERADAPGSRELEAWCREQPQPDLSAARERARAGRERLRAEIERQRRLEADERAQAEAQERAAAERAARLVQLSENGRQVEAFRDRLQAYTGRRQPVSGMFYSQLRQLIAAALGGSWNDADKRLLADAVAELAFQKIDFGSKDREIKRVLRQLRGET